MMDQRFAVTHSDDIKFFENSELTSLFHGYMHKFYKKTDLFVIKKNAYAFLQHLFQRFRFSLNPDSAIGSRILLRSNRDFNRKA